MATPGGLVDKQELIGAQLDTAHLGRVVNSKDASGAPISTSTNRTGGVNKTLDALETEYQADIDNFVQVSDQIIVDKTAEFDEAIQGAGGIPLGTWTAGVTTFTKYNEYAVYNGIPYKPRTTTSLPYVAQGVDPTVAPDDANVQPYQEITEAQVIALVESTIPELTDIVYDTVSDMVAGNPISAKDGDICTTDFFHMEVKQRWRFLASEPASGFYISGAGGWFAPLRKVKTRANLREFGLSEYTNPGVSSGSECSLLIAQAYADGVKELTIDDECYIGSYGTVIPESDITLKGSGRIWIDWAILPAGSIGTPIYPLTFSGDNVVIKKIRSDRVGGAVTWIEDEYSAMLLMTGENATVRHTDANYHRNYCFAFNSGKKIKFIGNTGKGLVDGLSQQFGIHCLLQMQDNLNGRVSHNEGSNWTNGILAGLSPQRSHITNNVFRDCGNHCIYVSSGDYTYVSNNEAYGNFTDIKVRGDWNTCMSNKVFGGSMSMTNRVVDSESTGYAANSIVCIGNEVHANRDLSVGLAIQSRTGFDGPVKRISCTGNTVECTGNNMPNGILILFESIESVAYSGNDLDCYGTVTVGVRITPTDGITTSKIKRLVVSGGASSGAENQSFAFTAQKLTASGFIGLSGGGSGVNAGGVTIRSDRSSISAFDVEVTNNIYCINYGGTASSKANLNCGTLTRPVGGTLPHVLSQSFTPNEGSEIVKVN